MTSALRVLRGLNNVLDLIVRTLAALLVGFMVLTVFGGAVTRYITGIGYNMVMELPPILMPWLIFPVAGVLMRSGSHIEVDFLPDRLSARPARTLRATVALIAIVAGVVFCYAGLEATSLFRMVGQRTEMEWSFPIWWIYLAFPVGFAILTSFAIENLLAALTEDEDPDRPPVHIRQAGS
jgi:TRAP-type C4-dicarboxylate transport system permease small subunit